jgi:hypothetical protein
MNWLRGRHQEPDGGLVLHDCNTRIENLRINDPRWRYSTAAVRQQRPLVDAFPERTTTLAGSATLPRSIAQAIAFERGRGSAVQLTDEGTQPGLSQVSARAGSWRVARAIARRPWLLRPRATTATASAIARRVISPRTGAAPGASQCVAAAQEGRPCSRAVSVMPSDRS